MLSVSRWGTMRHGFLHVTSSRTPLGTRHCLLLFIQLLRLLSWWNDLLVSLKRDFLCVLGVRDGWGRLSRGRVVITSRPLVWVCDG